MTSGYFFDTYAMIELVDGNPAYARYAEARPAFTKLNLYEFYLYLLRTSGFEVADRFLTCNCDLALDFGPDVIKEAAQLKLRVKAMSMADTIGYVAAGKLGVRFLTGDKAFEDLPNVEFVK